MKLQKIHFILFQLVLIILFASCRSTDPEVFTGYAYDPAGVAESSDREIIPQHKRTIGFLSDGVWISNEFPGSRTSDIYRTDEFQYTIEIRPEISPVNNSPWYGFKIWSSDSARVTVELAYPEEGRQRYTPKISTNGGADWKPVDPKNYRSGSSGILELDVSQDTLWVSAQEIYTTEHLSFWLDSLSEKSYISNSTAGYSHQGRPVSLLKISEPSSEPFKGCNYCLQQTTSP
jgi:cytosolic carboxypeptidase protein 6